MTDEQPYDFYHATDARRQGVRTLIAIHLFMAVFSGILYFFHTRFGMPFDGGFRIAMLVVMALVYLAFVAYAMILIVKGGQWIFAVRDGVLCVKSPAKSVGATFTVLVANIVSITQVKSGRGEHSTSRFYVVSKDGERHLITQNSSLNRVKLFARLRELNPDIREEYDTPSDVWNAIKSQSGARR